MRTLTALASFSIWALGALGSSSALAQSGSIPIFIVHKDNPIESITAAQVSDIFLKKQTRWENGVSVRFIDWREGSPIRNQFLSRVLGKTEREVELYWIGQKLYSGNSAPLKASSASMVINFVSKLNGAIGYLPSDAASLDLSNVKRIPVTGVAQGGD